MCIAEQYLPIAEVKEKDLMKFLLLKRQEGYKVISFSS